MEADAAALYSYEPGIIPVILQTPNYIRAVINSGNGVFWESSEAITQSRIEFRRERQVKVLESQPAKDLQFVFTEDALTINSSDQAEADLLKEQCDHLLYLCRLYPKLRLGVLRPGWVQNPSPNGSIDEHCGQWMVQEQLQQRGDILRTVNVCRRSVGTVVLDFDGAAPPVAFTPVRDSKNPEGPVLHLTSTTWSRFISSV